MTKLIEHASGNFSISDSYYTLNACHYCNRGTLSTPDTPEYEQLARHILGDAQKHQVSAFERKLISAKTAAVRTGDSSAFKIIHTIQEEAQNTKGCLDISFFKLIDSYIKNNEPRY